MKKHNSMKTAVAVMALAVIVLVVGIVYMYRPEKSYPFRGTILSEITNGLSLEIILQKRRLRASFLFHFLRFLSSLR